MWINAGMVPQRSKLARPVHGWLAQILGFMLGKAMSLLNLSTGLLILPAALSAL
jgi:hypothetical protein